MLGTFDPILLDARPLRLVSRDALGLRASFGRPLAFGEPALGGFTCIPLAFGLGERSLFASAQFAFPLVTGLSFRSCLLDQGLCTRDERAFRLRERCLFACAQFAFPLVTRLAFGLRLLNQALLTGDERPLRHFPGRVLALGLLTRRREGRRLGLPVRRGAVSDRFRNRNWMRTAGLDRRTIPSPIGA